MAKRLTPEQLARLDRDGYCGPVRIWDRDIALASLARLEAVERDFPDFAVRITQQPHLLLPWVDEMIRAPALLDAWGDQFGPDLLCTATTLRRKEPGVVQYAAWHQDTFYIRYEPVWIIAVVALTEQTAANGCVHVIPGSHRWPLLRHEDGDDERSVLTRSQTITEDFDDSSAVGVKLEPGEVLFFHPVIVHGSPPNHSARRRVLMLVEVCSPATRRIGQRGRASVLRGADTHGHFDLLPRARRAFGEAEVEVHREACRSRADQLYSGSDRVPPGLRDS